MFYSGLINEGVKSCLQNEQGDIVAVFSFPPQSGIFKGHFPGNPILSGVFQLEAVKYMLEHALECKCRLRRADNIKFVQPILPDQEFTLVLSGKSCGENLIDIRCKGTINAGNVKCTDIKARYEINGKTPEKWLLQSAG